jgi:hypothetical protein
MSYQLVAAIARSKNQASEWSPVDLSAVAINDIFATYSKVWLTLTNTAFTGQVYCDLDAIRTMIGADTRPRTLPQWLSGIGNASLPTVSALPTLTSKQVKYNDVYRAGYTVRRYAVGRHPDTQLPDGDKHDLLLSKDGVDFTQWWRYCLVTVNGMVHRVAGSNDGLVVIDGGRSGRIANDNQLGLISFREVGQIDTIPITASMIYKNASDQKYANYANIKLPYDVSNKTVLLVLGGYLHALDSVYRINGDQSLRIDFNNYKFPERIFESQQRLSLAPLQLARSPNNPEQVAVDNLYSDQSILAYLTLTQSFLVVVNTDALYVRRHPVEMARLPGRYITADTMGRYPLVSAMGRIYDYRAFPHAGKNVLVTDIAVDNHYNFATTMWKDEHSVDPTRYSSWPWDWAQAQLLEIGRT